MNHYGIDAIRNALRVAEDNMARAMTQKRANPEWKSGNGQSVDDVIEDYANQVTGLLEALRSVE